jgi:hypothetical protein
MAKLTPSPLRVAPSGVGLPGQRIDPFIGKNRILFLGDAIEPQGIFSCSHTTQQMNTIKRNTP